MSYSEADAARIRELLAGRKNIVERKMFGGVGFFLNGNMLVGLWKEFLIVRVDPEQYEDLLRQPHVKVFDITGRVMSGWIMVRPEGFAGAAAMQNWLEQAQTYVSALPAKGKMGKKAMTKKHTKKTKR